MTILGADHGFLEVEPHAPAQRRADRDVVVLLHGLGGTKDDWRFPVWRDKHWNHRSTPANKHSDNHLHPPIPLPEFSLSDMRTDVRCWTGILKALGHTVVNYGQDGPQDVVEVPLAQFEGRIAPFLRDEVLTGPLAGKRVVLLCHSRGGILARRYLHRHPEAAGWIGRVITLCSPHQGSRVARARQRLATAAAALALGPPGALAVDLVLRATDLLGESAGARQLLPTDPLFERLADPADVPDIRFHTFGGTSVRYSRIYGWAYAPQSNVPNVFDFPDIRYDWTQVPAQVPIASPLLDSLPDVVVEDEQDDGKGDGLVSDESSRLPGAPHTSLPINHAEALWDERLFERVATLLGTPLSDAGPVECGRPDNALTFSPPTVSFGGVVIGTTELRTMTIRNTTGSDVTIHLAASPPGVFSWPAVDTTLPHGEQTIVEFRFTPFDHRVHRELVRVTSTAAGSPHDIHLFGKGPGFPSAEDEENQRPTRLRFRPSVLTFGAVELQETETRPLTIRNETGRRIEIEIPASPPGSPFSWPARTATLEHNVERRITLSFRPFRTDLERGAITVISNTAASPDTITMMGRGGTGGFPIEDDGIEDI